MRVLRNYPQSQQFAAKVIKKYEGFDAIPLDVSLTAVEKMGDYGAPAPTTQDEADLKELETAAESLPQKPEPESSPEATPESPEAVESLPEPQPTP